MSNTKTNITGTVTNEIGGAGYGQISVEIDGETFTRRVYKEVLQACGFAVTQLKTAIEVSVTVEKMDRFWEVVAVDEVGGVSSSVDEKLLASLVEGMRPKPLQRTEATIKGMNAHMIYLACEGRKDLRLKMPVWNKFSDKKAEDGVMLDVSFRVTNEGNNVVAKIHGVVEKKLEQKKPASAGDKKPLPKRERKKPAPKPIPVMVQAVGQLAKVSLSTGQVWVDVQLVREGEEVLPYDGEDYRLVEVGLKNPPAFDIVSDEIYDFNVILVGDKALAVDFKVNVDCQPEREAEDEIVDDGQGELFDADGGNVVDIKTAKG